MDLDSQITKKQGIVVTLSIVLLNSILMFSQSQSEGSEMLHIQRSLQEYKQEHNDDLTRLNVELGKREVRISQIESNVKSNKDDIDAVSDLKGEIIELQVTIKTLANQFERYVDTHRN